MKVEVLHVYDFAREVWMTDEQWDHFKVMAVRVGRCEHGEKWGAQSHVGAMVADGITEDEIREVFSRMPPPDCSDIHDTTQSG